MLELIEELMLKFPVTDDQISKFIKFKKLIN